MFPLREYFASVEDVWLVWAGSVVLAACLTPCLVRWFVRHWKARRLALDERGAGYALSMVILLPFYTVLMCLVVESTLLLQVKVGTMYAAYAAARSAAVWDPAEISQGRKEAKVKEAAVQAIAPFASSRDVHWQAACAAGAGDFRADRAYYEAYRAYCSGGATEKCLARKRQFASRAVQVHVERSSGRYDADLRVTVQYEMPLNTGASGLLFGGRASWPGARFRTRKIRSTVTLEKEGVKGPNQRLGIRYDPDH